MVVSRDYNPRRSNNDNYWWCKCSCGDRVSVRGSALRKGQRYCGRCRRRGPLAKIIWTKYRRHAKEREIPFALSVEDFAKLIFLPCLYCGDPPSNKHKRKYTTEKYNGVDRIDNTRGYFLENCAPACGPCNLLKNSRSIRQFEAWIEKVYPRRHVWGLPLHEKSPYEALMGHPLSSPLPIKSKQPQHLLFAAMVRAAEVAPLKESLQAYLG